MATEKCCMPPPTRPAADRGEKGRSGKARSARGIRSEAMVMNRTKAAARAADGYVHDNPWTIAGVCAGVELLIRNVMSRG